MDGTTTVATEVLENIACQHCGKPLTECDGVSHRYTQAVKHKTLCPLCGGAAHNNDNALVMAFRCAMRQAMQDSGRPYIEKTDQLRADDVRALADWLEKPGIQYGKDASARALVAAGVTGVTAAKLTKRAAIAVGAAPPPPPVPSAPKVASTPPPPPTMTVASPPVVDEAEPTIDLDNLPD